MTSIWKDARLLPPPAASCAAHVLAGCGPGSSLGSGCWGDSSTQTLALIVADEKPKDFSSFRLVSAAENSCMLISHTESEMYGFLKQVGLLLLWKGLSMRQIRSQLPEPISETDTSHCWRGRMKTELAVPAADGRCLPRREPATLPRSSAPPDQDDTLS